jgi:hypothetical protein
LDGRAQLRSAACYDIALADLFDHGCRYTGFRGIFDSRNESISRGDIKMNRVLQQIIIAAKETPRQLLVPIIGAYKGIKQEYKSLEHMQTKKQHRSHM